jgi:formate dehydrogenase alpha subunit
MAALASALGCLVEYESAQDIQNEIMKLLPGYYNLGQPKKVTPTPDAYLSDGYAAEVPDRYASLVTRHSSPDGNVFGLIMGQVLYHSGKLSTQASGLIKLAPNTGRLRMSVQDIERLGLGDGVRVRVTSEMGSLEMGVEPDSALTPGCCFFPEHFNEPPVKDLFPIVVDPVTGVPAFKFTQVSIEKV